MERFNQFCHLEALHYKSKCQLWLLLELRVEKVNNEILMQAHKRNRRRAKNPDNMFL